MFDIKDPQITKYLLNEMSSEEKRAFEKRMEEEPKLREVLHDLQTVTESLKEELSAEALPVSHIEPRASFTDRIWKSLYVLVPVGAAACLYIFVVHPQMKSGSGDELVDISEVDSLVPPTSPSRNQVAPALKQEKFYGRVHRKGLVGGAVPSRSMKKPRGRSFGNKDRAFTPFDSSHREKVNTETYDKIVENKFIEVSKEPLSTFSIDVDTASYTNIRRFLSRGQRPPVDAVRIEEMINYFSYSYPAPSDGKPFSVHNELTSSPWNKNHKLLRVGLKGKEISWDKRKASNLVFLIDVSGSMEDPNKLPLARQGLKLLVDSLSNKDRVAIVVYAGASGLVLPSTRGNHKEEILAALDRLSAGGSTNGGAGIELAYKTARDNFIKDGINRVILATDGDFNVGTTDREQLETLIKKKAKSGVFLSVLGFGMGNYKDSQVEALANKGNGNYSYVDSYREAKRVLVEQIGGTLITIAKDVKIQVEFNPAKVSGYRLIGYENRMLAKEDFNNDKKDAGDIGAGHNVTALYEIVPVGVKFPKQVDDLKYQKSSATSSVPTLSDSDEWLTVKLRYKKPSGSRSSKIEIPVKGKASSFRDASLDTRFAAAVASFGMILRGSNFVGDVSYESVKAMALQAKGKDSKGYRDEFIELIEKAQKLEQ